MIKKVIDQKWKRHTQAFFQLMIFFLLVAFNSLVFLVDRPLSTMVIYNICKKDVSIYNTVKICK